MFCEKCGVTNADDAMFCKKCGAKLNEEQPSNGTTPIAANPNDKNRKIGIIAAAVMAAIVIVIIISIFGGRGYKATVEKYLDASFSADGEALLRLFPKELLDYVMEQEETYDGLDELAEKLSGDLQWQLDSIESTLDEEWDMTYEIISTEDVTGDDLDDLKNEYEDIDINLSAAKTVEVELTIQSDETENTKSMNISVVKIGNSWYLDTKALGFSL